MGTHDDEEKHGGRTRAEASERRSDEEPKHVQPRNMDKADRAGWSRAVFVIDGKDITVADVVRAAHFLGELEPVWTALQRLVERATRAADGGDPDEASLQSLSEQFRYERDLITAEETERWLEDRGLTLEDFNAYFLRHYWAETFDEPTERPALDLASAPDALWDLLRAELLLSGELDRMARQLSWRFAAAHAERDQSAAHLDDSEPLDGPTPDDASLEDWPARLGCDRPWLADMQQLEAAYRRQWEWLMTPDHIERSLTSMRLTLTRIDLETVEADSLDAVREVMMSVREDGMSMSEVASEGRYPYQRTEVVFEDLPLDVQQKVLCAVPGEVLEPLSHADGFQLHRLLGKADPDLADDEVRTRVERQMLERHFSELTVTCVRWLLVPRGAP